MEYLCYNSYREEKESQLEQHSNNNLANLPVQEFLLLEYPHGLFYLRGVAAPHFRQTKGGFNG